MHQTFPGEPVVIDPTIQNRPVPTTGSTFLAFTPGFQLSLDGMVDSAWTKMTSVYFYSTDSCSPGFQQQSGAGNQFYLWTYTLVSNVEAIVSDMR